MSSAWRTEPIGGPSGQPAYRNAVVQWRPAPPWRDPTAALAAMLAVECALGRERRERWGPRRIDLDLLAWDAAEGREREGRRAPGRRGARPDLPHPRALERAFVLLPWAEVAPSWIHPAAGRSLADLAGAVDRSGADVVGEAEGQRWATARGWLVGP